MLVDNFIFSNYFLLFLAAGPTSTGTMILYRNGVSSSSYYFGIVQLYYGRWGTSVMTTTTT